jgi:hypothetical protein
MCRGSSRRRDVHAWRALCSRTQQLGEHVGLLLGLLLMLAVGLLLLLLRDCTSSHHCRCRRGIIPLKISVMGCRFSRFGWANRGCIPGGCLPKANSRTASFRLARCCSACICSRRRASGAWP